jgi:hypothetical protein
VWQVRAKMAVRGTVPINNAAALARVADKPKRL